MNGPDDRDQTSAFLQSLPEIGMDETFRFACHPRVPCFNACCSDLNLMLTPYDVLRLRRALGESSQMFITARADVHAAGDTGLPMLALRMAETEGRPCPFVSPQGCTVYGDRPAACRTYPLGRATRLDDTAPGGMAEQFFVVRENHCRGFEQPTEWSPRTWLSDQGLVAYNQANDRLMRLLGRQKRQGRPVEPRQANMALLALYQLDNFQTFVRDMRVFQRLEISAERQAQVLADEAAALDFGLDWLELALFGDCPTLQRKAKP